MPQHSESLPIACVEGWTATIWRSALSFMSSTLRQVTLSKDQLHDDRSLLALKVEGEDLSLDHGYPARIIVPALPGVHNTKWVGRMTFS